jgi:hypothetical protein
VKIKTIANLGRFKDIVFTLIKYGFGGMVEHLDFPGKPKKRDFLMLIKDLVPMKIFEWLLRISAPPLSNSAK